MNLTGFLIRKRNTLALAFAFPTVGMLFIMLIGHLTFVGQYSMLYADMYHQYFPFFLEFRRSILSGESLIYNWNIGLGMDFLGLIAYYLGSPFNLISIIVPENFLTSYFSLLVPIKLGFASLFFAYFLKKTFFREDISVSLFGCFYALCAWALGYQWNVMWLDTFALLPLVVLGTITLIKDRKFILYICTLFLSILFNYYIGLFVCYFVFLLFISYEICNWDNFTKFSKDLGRIAFFSLIAIGMTSILSLPTLIALQTTQSGTNSFPAITQFNFVGQSSIFALIKAMGMVAGNMNGGISPTFMDGLPNIYCGVFTAILSILYLLCNEIQLRKRICALFLLLFFNISFVIPQLDYIWNGFHITNMIPFRFSFLYSFVMLYMAYSAWVHREAFCMRHITIAAVTSFVILFCFQGQKDSVFWTYNVLLLLLYLSVLLYFISYRSKPTPNCRNTYHPFFEANHQKQQVCTKILLSVMTVELIMNLVNFGVTFPCTDISDYPKGREDTVSALEYMKQIESDTLFYRTEFTHTQTFNDSALNGYHGITAFTSSANVNVTNFMKTLGFGAKNTYNRYSYEDSSPVANLFLALKYMVERDGVPKDNPYFDMVYSSGSVYLLENNAYLPLGFLTSAQLLNIDFNKNENPFVFQNQLMQHATGQYGNVWNILPENRLTISSKGSELTPHTELGSCSYSTDNSKGSYVTYGYTADSEGLMCITVDFPHNNDFTVSINGELLYSETFSLPQMLAVCTVRPGDVINIQVLCNSNENGKINISAAILNDELFRNGYEVLSESTLQLTYFSNTRLNGKISCNRDGILYTSIPQNGNWNVLVDGHKTETVTIGNTMIGVLLTEGDHDLEFIYYNSALYVGAIITFLSAIAFITIFFFIYYPFNNRRKGKYEK